jgi:hypothetical protein
MRNFIVAVSLAAFANVLAHADDSYAPPEADSTERALPDVEQASGSEESESAPSAAAGDSAQPDGESTGDEQADAPAPRELDV